MSYNPSVPLLLGRNSGTGAPGNVRMITAILFVIAKKYAYSMTQFSSGSKTSLSK